MSISTQEEWKEPKRFEVLTTTGEPELSTTDVPAPWLESRFAASPLPQRPLSRVVDHAALDIEIPSGQTSVEVQVPTVGDGVSEPAETLRLRLASYWAPRRDRW
ncbi:hypothetical protein [Streptomyces sp. NPDC047315]|uniref:hypothetical protein n=1 Tax=Streptomyces sp. NPDC047315 TaxID=3155142 RepID=UPI0033CEB55A